MISLMGFEITLHPLMNLDRRPTDAARHATRSAIRPNRLLKLPKDLKPSEIVSQSEVEPERHVCVDSFPQDVVPQVLVH